MFTQCRGCGEVFTLSVEDVVSSKGYVRCSSCGAVFNSLETLAEHHSIEAGNLRLHESDNPPPLLSHESKPSVLVTHSILQAESKKGHRKILVSAKREAPVDKKEEYTLEIKPDFIPEKLRDNKSSPLLWSLIVFFSLSALVFQSYLGLKKGSLKLPQIVATEKICELIPCYKGGKEVNLNKIALVSRNIRQHPGRDNALIITTGIVNGDEKTQNFPALKIKLSDLSGDIIAMRRFLPSEYLDKETIKVGMLPNTLVPITLELQSPGKNAVTFEVGFSPTYGQN